MKRCLIALCVIGAAHTAWAQSKRYPPVQPDRELEQERRSKLWESALHPDLAPYRELVRDAKRLIKHDTPEDRQAALDKLGVAIGLIPDAPDAYLVRGQLYLAYKEWAKCADDLAHVEADGKLEDPSERTRARLDLGNCQARAGRHAEAEATYMRALASAKVERAELFMRLGEVRIALGKLDESIDALDAALDIDSSTRLARWLLMVAYDRARRPSEALEHAQMAVRYDASRTDIERPALPLLGTDEDDYVNGLAFLYAQPKPELALLYFRHYVRVASDSPWKKRAEEHVRELEAMKMPARETITSTGTSAIVVDDMQKALQRPVAAMRQCLVKLPSSAFTITVTRHGPRTPERRDRPIYRLPPAGSKVANLLTLDVPAKEDVDAAVKCLEQHAARLAPPLPKERDTYYHLTFIVVAP